MVQTAAALKRLGIDVDISVEPVGKNADKYEIIHVFNLMRPFESSLAINEARRYGKPIAFSSIYWDFSEYNAIGRDSVLHKMLATWFDEFTVEKVKDVVRHFRGQFPKQQILEYVSSSFKEKLKYVDIFLPNSEREGELVKERVAANCAYQVVFNAVDKDRFFLKNDGLREKKAVLAARVDPRKNILNLVKSVDEIPLDIFGKIAPNYNEYYERVKKAANRNVRFKDFVDPEFLCSIYNEYALHIMPSWLETPGLSQLEAAACGCNIVSTSRGSAKEYFGHMATYCDPGSLTSIKGAVAKSLENLRSPREMSDFVLDNYTWDKSAKQTLLAYERILR
jgi:glycosyltransferase involved in cell wall biosynthesis